MKEFKTVKLTSEHLFSFCEVLDAIGIEKFAEVFKVSEDSEDVESTGRAVGAKILKILVKELPNAKSQIREFLSICVEDTSVKEIEEMPLAEFIGLIKTIFKGNDMKDFFTQAASLFTEE